MTDRVVSTSRKLTSRTSRKKTFVEKSPLGGPVKGITNKFTNLGNSIRGVFTGMLLVLAGFVLIWGSVNWVKDSASVVESLELVQNDSIGEDDGLMKTSGTPELKETFTYDYSKCTDDVCDALGREDVAVDGIMYYSARYERYEQYVETTTETREIDNGDEVVTEEYEIETVKEGWRDKGTDSMWAELVLGTVTIKPDSAKTKMDSETTTVVDVVLPSEFDEGSLYVAGSKEEASAKVGDTRMSLTTIPVGEELIVVGEVYNGVIEGGETFVISDMSETQLLEELRADQQTTHKIYKYIAIALFTLGFMMLIGPILALADFIPLVGGMARTVAFVVGLVSAIVVVNVGIFVLQYWWALLIIVVLLAAGAYYYITQSESTGNKETAS